MGTITQTLAESRWAVLSGRRRASRNLTAGLFMCADALAVLAAGVLAVALWSRLNPAVQINDYLSLWPTPLLFVAAYAWLGLYPGAGLSPVEELRELACGATVVCLAGAAFIFLTRDTVISRGVMLVMWMLAVILGPLFRAAVRNLCSRRAWWGVPVLVLGAGEPARRLVGRLCETPGLGLKPVAILDEECEQEQVSGVPVAGSLDLAPELAGRLGIRHVLVAMPNLSRRQLLQVLDRLESSFSHMIVIPDLFGMASLWVSPRDLGGELGLEIRQNLLIPFNRFLKRSLDMALTLAAALPALLIVGAAGLWIKLSSRGPVFFRQLRAGEQGRPILVWKLRTMHVDAERMLREHLEKNPEARREWERHFKLKNDPRLLPVVGWLLRRTSLDELPQLWNVLKGEMSLVGPRPLPDYHLAQFDADFRRLRARVSPGLTGLWQVTTRSDGDLDAQKALDAYYIRNWSVWLDIYILARTVKAVIARRGAY